MIGNNPFPINSTTFLICLVSVFFSHHQTSKVLGAKTTPDTGPTSRRALLTRACRLRRDDPPRTIWTGNPTSPDMSWRLNRDARKIAWVFCWSLMISILMYDYCMWWVLLELLLYRWMYDYCRLWFFCWNCVGIIWLLQMMGLWYRNLR